MRRTTAGAALAFVLIASAAATSQPVEPPPARTEPAPRTQQFTGTIPATVSLVVTGNPADGAFLESAIRAELDRRIRPTLRPGASIRYGAIVPWPLLPLPPGGAVAVNVSVVIAGSNEDTWVSGIATVNVTNLAVPQPKPAVLLFSDDPEYIPSEGLVFRGTVESGKAVRLYYYHSDLGVPRDLDVVLSARVPTRAQVIQSGAGPDLDVMSVGHTVSRNFLMLEQRNEGTVLDVVPGAPVVLRHDLMFQSELVAGAADVQVLSGGPLTVSVVASPAGGRPQPYLEGPRLSYDGHRRHGAFDLDGFGDLRATYTVGGPDIAVKYGSSSHSPRNVDPGDGGRDFGDYGVVYRIVFKLVNPTDSPHVVYLYERPHGGPVRSSFIVDGGLKEVGCARLSQPYWFMTYQLAPRANGETTMITMADGGSYYPLEVGVTETPPVWNTPPVGSVDGCSPLVTPAPAPAPAQPAPTATGSALPAATAAPTATARAMVPATIATPAPLETPPETPPFREDLP